MKIIKPSKKRTVLVISSLIGVLLLAGVSFAAWQSRDRSLSNAELTEATDKTSAVKESQVKQDEIQNNGATLPSKSPEANNQLDTSDSNSNNTSGASPEKPQISRASQSAETVKVVALLQQDSSGYCELELRQADAQAITRKSDITVGPTYYVCSFNVPRDQIPAAGNWDAVVVHYRDGSTTKSDTTMVEVQ